MAELSILKYPHPKLRRPAKKIAAVDDAVRRLATDMRETMEAAGGIGLAAPQVGRSLRLLVADITRERKQPITLINPSVIAREGELSWEEGCLSIPGVTAPVKRSRYVKIGGLDLDGEAQIIEGEELLAVCLQHEMDHLNGMLFIDHLSGLRRARLLAQYAASSP